MKGGKDAGRIREYKEWGSWVRVGREGEYFPYSRLRTRISRKIDEIPYSPLPTPDEKHVICGIRGHRTMNFHKNQ